MSETPLALLGQPRTMLDHARDALNARMTKDDLRLVLENTVTYAAALEARVAELEAERHSTNDALAAVTVAMRAAEGRTVDEDPIRYALTAAAEAAVDPCHPCGCPKRFDRHAWGCPTLAVAEMGGVSCE